jgi:hypothetical protein
MNELMFYTPDKKGFVRISNGFFTSLAHNLCSVVCVPRNFFFARKNFIKKTSLAKGHKIAEYFFFLSSISSTKYFPISALVFKKGLYQNLISDHPYVTLAHFWCFSDQPTLHQQKLPFF